MNALAIVRKAELPKSRHTTHAATTAARKDAPAPDRKLPPLQAPSSVVRLRKHPAWIDRDL